MADLDSHQDAKHNADAGIFGGKDPKSLSVREYLDSTVVPVLLKGMSQLVKERPADPIEKLAQILLAESERRRNEK